MFRCLIYFAIIDGQVPSRKESNNNGDWKAIDLKELNNYKLTNSLSIKIDLIKKAITNKFKSINSSKKKRKLNDNNGNIEDSTTSPEETTTKLE
jgi:hypothetical protein